MDRESMNVNEALRIWSGTFSLLARKQGIFVSLLFILSLACRDPENNPHRLADLFVKGVENCSLEILDPIMDWNEIVVNDYYVTRDYFIAQTAENKRKIVNDYKQRFSTDFLPSAAKANYNIEAVYIARDIADAHIKYSLPGMTKPQKGKKNDLAFTISMKLDSGQNRWYIVNLGDFLRLNFLKGDFDPEKFYLPEPILP